MNPQDVSDLNSRCRNALLHPVTLAAVGLLLLNDLVFRALWSSPWTTGKLSDLTWVVFACPLLAFLLSFAAPRRHRYHRVAFLTAYVGLPLLYVCFNTFQSVHTLIATPLAFMSGRLAASTPDPTDSLVIPLALAIALWVWRRSANSGPSTVRRQLVFVVAAVAAFASVATSEGPPILGIEAIGVTDDHTLIAGGTYALFTSDDGGMTWVRLGDSRLVGLDSETQGGTRVATSRGVYSVEDAGIVLTTTSASEVVYPTEFLRDPGNVKYQRHATKGLGARSIAHNAGNITYHFPTGHVVAAFGIQGVLVGDTNGNWHEVAVGPYAPTDFSALAKFRSVWKERGLWEAAVGLCLAFLAVAMIASHGNTPLGGLGRTLCSIIVMAPAIISMFLLFPGESNVVDTPARESAILAMILGSAGVAMFLPPVRLWLAAAIALLLMLGLFALAFLVGATQGFDMTAARVFAVLLVGVAAGLLYWYLGENWRKTRP